MFAGLGAGATPEYDAVAAPMLALVLAGTSHPLTPPDASAELRTTLDAYWTSTFLPWVQRRTQEFRDAAPSARIVELDTSNHTIFVAREDETVRAISDFLAR